MKEGNIKYKPKLRGKNEAKLCMTERFTSGQKPTFREKLWLTRELQMDYLAVWN